MGYGYGVTAGVSEHKAGAVYMQIIKQFSIKNLGRPDTVQSESEEELVWALIQPSWLEFSIAHNLLIQNAS
jgi:hypothetical protein